LGGIKIPTLAMRSNYILCTGLHIADRTVFLSSDVAIAHQLDLAALYPDDAMNHKATIIDPGQHHIAHSYCLRLDKLYTLPSANDEWQHAIALHRQYHPLTFIHQFDEVK
jgi:hypothetical protein